MADGSEQPIGAVKVGDEVLTWGRRSATVVGIVDAQRPAEDLVEALLDRSGEAITTSLVSTADHPYWSASQQTLVSRDPAGTMENYRLGACLDGGNVSLALPVETLEDSRGAPVPALFRQFQGPNTQREARGATALVPVRTLMLEGAHWFYAAGIRVHNKGCFVGDTAISMADGSFKPIQEVHAGERVLSWDPDSDPARILKHGVGHYHHGFKCLCDLHRRPPLLEPQARQHCIQRSALDSGYILHPVCPPPFACICNTCSHIPRIAQRPTVRPTLTRYCP